MQIVIKLSMRLIAMTKTWCFVKCLEKYKGRDSLEVNQYG